MKTKTTEPTEQDAIGLLIDAIDKYFFRLHGLTNILGGSCYTSSPDILTVRQSLQTKGAKEYKKLFYENLDEVGDPELRTAIDDAAIGLQSQEDSFSILLGLIMGLRVAGIDSERAKSMARTWRLGLPQDDK